MDFYVLCEIVANKIRNYPKHQFRVTWRDNDKNIDMMETQHVSFGCHGCGMDPAYGMKSHVDILISFGKDSWGKSDCPSNDSHLIRQRGKSHFPIQGRIDWVDDDDDDFVNHVEEMLKMKNTWIIKPKLFVPFPKNVCITGVEIIEKTDD